ncbi:translation initiation factor IF-2-like [Eublepharis macularius]|uniref:Translation initiation factor IF-2-like n=1 Tax=Eublepharis macularius TaxID=481883 RepID=A0AA97JIE4_EUBMA|nr:translation initiation factor IF-2-like [Eublepharis macularius]
MRARNGRAPLSAPNHLRTCPTKHPASAAQTPGALTLALPPGDDRQSADRHVQGRAAPPRPALPKHLCRTVGCSPGSTFAPWPASQPRPSEREGGLCGMLRLPC